MDKTDMLDRIGKIEKKYSLLANNLVGAIWVLDVKTLRYVFISSSITQLRNYNPKELKNISIRESLTPAAFAHASEVLEKELKDYQKGKRRKVKLELEMYKKDGSTIWIEITASFFKEPEGPLRIIGVSRNIDERKRLALERDELIEKLQESLETERKLRKEIKVLHGLLPICAECKKIRDEKGNWHDLETFIEERSEAEFTHTICPTCLKTLYPEIIKDQDT